jgi:hypothetical protein
MDPVQRGAHFDGAAHGFLGGNRTPRQAMGNQFAGNRFFTEEIQSGIRHVGCSSPPVLEIPRHNSHGHVNFIVRAQGLPSLLRKCWAYWTLLCGALYPDIQGYRALAFPNSNDWPVVLAAHFSCARLPQSERTRAHRGIAPRLAFCYSVGRAPLTLPVAHVQSKLAPIFTSGTEVTKNVESQEDPARILP